jgi:hypothetical protein
MKNKYYFVSILCSLLLLTNACNDDRLDVDPLNILTNSQVFESESAIQAYMSSLYANMPIEDFYFHRTNPAFPLANNTDESISCFNDEKSTSADGTWTPYWGYDNIRNINEFLINIDNANLSSESISVYKGEAIFIRAYCYFALAKRYGGVPIIKEPQIYTGNNIAELQVPRNTEKEVFDFIAEDLDEAINMLPEKTIPSRATKYAALALKSRAMLYAASVAKYGSVMLGGLAGIPASDAPAYWQSAYDASKKIMDDGFYTLYDKNSDKARNFQQLFIDKDNPEAIFIKEFLYPTKTHGYDNWFLPFGVRGPEGYGSRMGPTLEMVEQFENIDGTFESLKVEETDGSPIFYSNPTDLFKDKDPRLMGTVIVPFDTYKGTVIDVQAGLYDQGVKVEAGDYSALYNPTTHQLDNESGTMHIVGLNGIGGGEKTQTGFYVKKYLNYNLEQSRAGYWGSDQSWIEFRYGEILLNYAEAAIELNKVVDAKSAVNQLRARAGIRLLDDAEVTIDRVRHERLVELAFEHHRWWDYRRWRIADDILNNTRFHALKPYYDIQQQAYRFEIDLAGRYPRTFEPKVYYERIDPSELMKNPNLVQNPNYN